MIRFEECLSPEQLRAAWPVMHQLRTAITEGQYLDRVAAARKQGYRLFAALDDHRIVGLMGWRIWDDLVFGHGLYIDDLVVDAAERGRGHGRALLLLAADIARDAGCVAVRLNSGFEREAAHKFYEASGMPKTGFSFRMHITPPA